MTHSGEPTDQRSTDALRRIADALERLVPKAVAAADFEAADAFVWRRRALAYSPSRA